MDTGKTIHNKIPEYLIRFYLLKIIFLGYKGEQNGTTNDWGEQKWTTNE